MSKKINKVGYNEFKCNPVSNPHNRPVLMKDGKVIDQDAIVIEDKVIAEGMRYVAKMAKGLATGVLSHDPEYIELQDKVLGELISKKSAEVKKEIKVISKRILRDYADAHKAQDKALAKMQEFSARLAESDGYSFYVDDNNNVYKSHVPGGTPLFGKGCPTWTRSNIGDLKKDIEARKKATAEFKKKNGPQTTHEKIDDALDKFNKPEAKRIEILANKIIDATTKKKKKVVKKTTKKKVVKKKTTKAKKRDRK